MGDPEETELKGNWTVVPLNEDEEENSPMEESSPEYCFRCCWCIKCCEKDEAFKARSDLYGIIFDWIVDFIVGTTHILRNQLIGGILTFLIVINAGAIITFTNFSHQVSKSMRTTTISIRKELRKSHKIYTGLSYIPSFFPICSAKLRLSYAKKLKKCKDASQREELQQSLNYVKDKALFDSCCETFLEGFPQAVLQIVLLFSKSYGSLDGFSNFFLNISDYLPIITIFTAMNGITHSPISVIESRNPTKVIKFGEKVTAYASNSVRVFSCALFINAIQEAVSHFFMGETSVVLNVASIVMSGLVIFCLLGGPFIIKHEIDKKFKEWETITMNVTSALSLLTSLAGFGSWAVVEVSLNGWKNEKFITISTCFSFLVVLYCCGIILYRETLDMYQRTASDVIVQAYFAVKKSLSRLFRIFWRKKNDNRGETIVVSVNE